MSIVVVDYQKGNLRSVQKGLELAGAEARISASAQDIYVAQGVVLPGVGSFADASAELEGSGQMQAMRERIAAGVPFLGICLGLQLLFELGDEGMPLGQWAPGLGVLAGRCRRLDAVDARGKSYKVPHVGWNQVNYLKGHPAKEGLRPLFDGIADGSNFYFTHSYQCEPEDTAAVLATVTHATELPSVVRSGSAFGVQFHPEKSSRLGALLLRNFVEYVRQQVG